MLGCCLIYFHFLWAIHPIRPVLCKQSVKSVATFASALCVNTKLPWEVRERRQRFSFKGCFGSQIKPIAVFVSVHFSERTVLVSISLHRHFGQMSLIRTKIKLTKRQKTTKISLKTLFRPKKWLSVKKCFVCSLSISGLRGIVLLLVHLERETLYIEGYIER